jgi:hypothetical protein
MLAYRVGLKAIWHLRHGRVIGGVQIGQGAPAPPQPQARSPNHGLSLWFSQTQRQSSQREQACTFIQTSLMILRSLGFEFSTVGHATDHRN